MGKIRVTNIRVYAYHGCLSEETAIGSDYRVDVEVIADFDTGKPISRDMLYKKWNQIMNGSGLIDSPNDYSYYCLRHTFATYRLQYGKVDIRTLAKIMGCSVVYIEQHYDSARVENMTDYITRGVSREDGFSQVVLE